MTRFDRYIVVDWSAAGAPATGADSVWIADLSRASGDCRLTNPPTRAAAERTLDELLTDVGEAGQRALVGIDVALGYPAGTAERFGLDGATPWSAMWHEVRERLHDDDRNRNDRFVVAAQLNGSGARPGPSPFWGCPPSAANELLHRTKPTDLGVSEFRATDRRLRELGHRPFSVWQLLGAGSVGSQTLTAIPVLSRLGDRHRMEIWPFTTGVEPPSGERGGAVLAEVWPSGFDLDLPAHWVRDAAQVDGVARRLAVADADGRLEAWWSPATGEPATVVAEEGWVLGVP